MPTKKTAAETKAARPKPPKILRLAYSVPRDVVVDLDGSLFHFYAADRRGLRARRPLVIDDATWAKLKNKAAVKRMLDKGQIEVPR
jgi:hypothetical protein